MSVDASTEDLPASAEQPQSKETSAWNREILEYQEEENKRNPLPSIRGPIIRDRQAYVPDDVEKYLKNRYGSDIKVSIGNQSGKEDRSGYSYLVHTPENSDMVRLAEMSTERVTISMLPPDYNGYLKDEKERIEKQNKLLTKDSRPEELTRTLWVINESARAQELHKSQLQNQNK